MSDTTKDYPQARRILRWPEVKHISHKSRTQAWRDEKAGTFPRRVRLGPNSIGWFEDELLAYLENLPRGPAAEHCVTRRVDAAVAARRKQRSAHGESAT